MTAWRTSSRSYGGGNCVQVADGIRVRDSKDPGPVLAFGAAAWTAFLRRVKDGADAATAARDQAIAAHGAVLDRKIAAGPAEGE